MDFLGTNPEVFEAASQVGSPEGEEVSKVRHPKETQEIVVSGRIQGGKSQNEGVLLGYDENLNSAYVKWQDSRDTVS